MKIAVLAVALAVTLPAHAADGNMQRAQRFADAADKCWADVLDNRLKYHQSRWCLSLTSLDKQYLLAMPLPTVDVGKWTSDYQVYMYGQYRAKFAQLCAVTRPCVVNGL